MKPKKFAYANTLRDPEEEKYATRTFKVMIKEQDENEDDLSTYSIAELKACWGGESLTNEQCKFIEDKLKEYTYELRDYLNDSLKVEIKKLYF